MDFGIAKARGTGTQGPQRLTVAGMIAGTPAYMAPEQINSFSAATAASDIYSLGVVAYEMLTGQLPFSAPDFMPLLVMHLSQPPPPPRSLNPQLAPELEAVVLSMLEKDPSRRPASCQEVAQRLSPVLVR
jgi:serine/threonine-protein kinase